MRLALRYLTLAVALAAFSQYSHGQLDPTFGTGGRVQRTLPGTQLPIKSFLLPDGKIMVLNGHALESSAPTYSLVRFNQDGSIDTTYGVNGEAALAIPFTSPCCVSRGISDAIRQPDGKFVIVGADGDGLVVRVLENGSLDTTFSDDGIDRPNVNQAGADIVASVFYLQDSKILILGRITGGSFLMRYDSSGNLDPTYGNQGGYIFHSGLGTTSQWTAGMQSGERPVILTAGSAQEGRLVRFKDDGTLDTGFSSSTLTYASNLRKMVILANDKIVVCDVPTTTDSFQRTHSNLRLRSFNSNGTQDTAFGTGGVRTVDIAPSMPDRTLAMIEKPDGAIIVASQTDIEPNRSTHKGGYVALVQLSSTGAVTGSSLTATRTAAPPGFQIDVGTTLHLQSDGKILLSTYHESTTDTANPSDVILIRCTGIPMNTYRFRGVPFDFSDFTRLAKGVSLHSVLRPSRNLYLGNTFIVFNFGLPGDIDVHSDYTGNFRPELAVFRPSNGNWYISRNEYYVTQNQFIVVNWGLDGDIPVPYDYDGDGKSDIAVFRPSNGTWYVHNITNGLQQTVRWGVAGDQPVPGDFDGDGIGDFAVWRPSSGVWYVLRSSDGQVAINTFGLSGDIPVQEDYDGDGSTDIAVWRPSTGVWYIWRSSDAGFTIMQFGLSGDIPTPADYDGDTKTDISVWRSGTWYHFLSSTNAPVQFPYGLATDRPLPARN